MRLERQKSQLLIIDMQEKVLPHVVKPKRVLRNCTRLIDAARRLKIPVTLAQHYAKGLGPTVKEVRKAAGDRAAILDKVHFSCMREQNFAAYLCTQRSFGSTQIVVAGIEAHVCVGQSVLDLLDVGFDVFVVADAVSSRRESDRDLALERLRQNGAQSISLETVVFEWLDRAATPEFNALLPLVK